MTLSKKQITFAYAALISLGLYGPLLEILRKNTNIQELYGYDGLDFSLVFLGGLLLPLIITVALAIKTKSRFVTIFWLFLSAIFFINPMPLGLKILVLVLLSLFTISLKKNHEGFLKIFVWAAILVLPDVAYKTIFLMRDHLNLHFTSQGYEKFTPVESAPKNIFFFLLDGTDLTSSYLDEKNLPRQDLLPNLHQHFKSDFAWFPKSYSNGPQTYLSIPVLISGTFNYAESKKNIDQSREFLSALAQNYDVTGFFYLNFYRNFCVQHRASCYPFKDANTSDRERGSTILFEMYVHRLTWGLTKLPFKLGDEFQPDEEPYKFEEFMSKLKEKKDRSNFFYTHIIRRSLHGLMEFDKNLNELIEYLKAEGLYQDSMIVITADHGYDETQTGRKYGQHSKFTPRVFRIPIAIKGANGQGFVSELKAQTVDVMPSIMTAVYGPEVTKSLNLSGIDLLTNPSIVRKHPIHCKKEATAEFLDDYKVSACEKVK